MPSNQTHPSAVAERIDLPGGWKLLPDPAMCTNWIIAPDGKTVGNFDGTRREEFAAAMRAEPAAPVNDTWPEQVKRQCENRCGEFGDPPCYQLPDLTSDASKDIKPCAECTTSPGDVAMQAADANTGAWDAWNKLYSIMKNTREPFTDKPAEALNREAVIREMDRLKKAAQAPVVCQSDEDVADKIESTVRAGGFHTGTDKRIVPLIARHRQAHEATAWQKGCESMREAAADAVDPRHYSSAVHKGFAAWAQHDIRALPIPPAPKGGRDNG